MRRLFQFMSGILLKVLESTSCISWFNRWIWSFFKRILWYTVSILSSCSIMEEKDFCIFFSLTYSHFIRLYHFKTRFILLLHSSLSFFYYFHQIHLYWYTVDVIPCDIIVFMKRKSVNQFSILEKKSGDIIWKTGWYQLIWLLNEKQYSVEFLKAVSLNLHCFCSWWTIYFSILIEKPFYLYLLMAVPPF